MADVKSTRPDPGGMKKAFKTPVPSTRVDEEQPKEAPKEDSGSMWDGLGARMNRGIKAYRKKIGG